MRSAACNLENELAKISLRFAHDGYFTRSEVRVEQDGAILAESVIDSDSPTYALTPSHWQFDIASLTKLFTTTAILRLASQQKINLDSDIAHQNWAAPLIEAVRLEQDSAQVHELLSRLTIASLLTHTSSLPAWYPFYAGREARIHAGLETQMPKAQQIDREAQSKKDALHEAFGIPGDFFSIIDSAIKSENRVPLGQMLYSDINFMLLGVIAGVVLQSHALGEAMEHLVLAPLALGDTTFEPDFGRVVPTEFGNRIEMEMVRSRGLTFSGWRPIDLPLCGQADDGNSFYYFDGLAGHAGLFSTARDLCSLCNLYLFEGRRPTSGATRWGSAEVLDPALAKRAATNTGLGRGLGFEFGPRYPDGFGHTGFTGTMVYINPERRLSVAILTNRLNVPEPRSVDPYRSAIVQAILASQNPTFSLGS
ncbi:MAG TPA: serine hydrolase domain-containing protein [Spirochaetales bacterium]|nr:serine hydrolase domain-containing protein [Spirochaetales bacterium]